MLGRIKAKIRNYLNFKKTNVTNLSKVKFRYDIQGEDNTIIIKGGCHFSSPKIRIRGSHNTIIIEEGVHIGKQCSFWMEGEGIKIVIGKNTSFTQKCHFCAQENNVMIQVGDDCMFSNEIIVRTSDSHPIYDLTTKERLNDAKSVSIGNHVWIAPNTKIMKGAQIGAGSIIGSNTMVSKEYPANSLIVGMPGRVVRENVSWTRERLF